MTLKKIDFGWKSIQLEVQLCINLSTLVGLRNPVLTFINLWAPEYCFLKNRFLLKKKVFTRGSAVLNVVSVVKEMYFEQGKKVFTGNVYFSVTILLYGNKYG